MIADTAMWATWRSIKLAGDAPLHAHGNAVDFYALVQRSSEIILPIFVRRRFNERIILLRISVICNKVA